MGILCAKENVRADSLDVCEQESLRVRFKVKYAVNGAEVNEQGEYADS